MIPIVIAGYTYTYTPHDARVIHLDKPLMPQLTGFAEFPAEILHPQDRDLRFEKALKEIQEGYLVTQLASNTINKNLYEGVYNTIHNYVGVLAAGRLETETVKRKVYVIGNGASKSEAYYSDDATIICCWHAMEAMRDQVRLDYVGHIDGILPMHWGTPPPGVQLIASPMAAKEFWQFPNPYLVYVDNAPECRAWVDILGYQHPKVDGSVVHMLVYAAILMGAEEIHLTGMDFGYATLEEAIASGYEGFYEKVNKAGEPWYTNFVFDVFKDGIERIVSLHPELTFVNHSVGLPIKGVDV